MAVGAVERVANSTGHRQAGNGDRLALEKLPAAQTWKVRSGNPGRPAVTKEVWDLNRRISCENPIWGAPRIHGELLKLGIDTGKTSVSKYLCSHRNSDLSLPLPKSAVSTIDTNAGLPENSSATILAYGSVTRLGLSHAE